MDREPLTIEVLGVKNGTRPPVLDRVIGGTVYLNEAKRIGKHLLAITEGRPKAFRVVNKARRTVYEWRVGDEPTH